MSDERLTNRDWSFHPNLPIPLSPIFAWPPRPLAWLKWISAYWLALGVMTVNLALAVIVYWWLQPDWPAPSPNCQ